jgi:hypothetical protein
MTEINMDEFGIPLLSWSIDVSPIVSEDYFTNNHYTAFALHARGSNEIQRRQRTNENYFNHVADFVPHTLGSNEIFSLHSLGRNEIQRRQRTNSEELIDNIQPDIRFARDVEILFECKSLENISTECCICQEDDKTHTDMCSLNCNHTFCKLCINTFLKTPQADNSENFGCPLCRTNITHVYNPIQN